MKIKVQRQVIVWIEEEFDVPDLSQDSIDRAIDYDIDISDSEVFWDTQEDLGPVEVYDDKNNLIYKNE